jgi:6,7-dimethyl-8-ribityllumazine synthase
MPALNKKIVVVVSRFNEFITERLLEGCLEELSRQGVGDKAVRVFRVPGAVELPLVALKAARQKSTAAVICLGAVIRGETIHFELVSEMAAFGIGRVALDTGKPVIFGVITTETVDQAYKRSDRKGSHKGRDAAQAALEMLATLAQVSKTTSR